MECDSDSSHKREHQKIRGFNFSYAYLSDKIALMNKPSKLITEMGVIVMIEIFKTVNNEIFHAHKFEEGVWVSLVNPNDEELNNISKSLDVEMDFLKAALDEEERARIESNNRQTLIIGDIPIVEKENEKELYVTIPLAIITVCLEEDAADVLKQIFELKKVNHLSKWFKDLLRLPLR